MVRPWVAAGAALAALIVVVTLADSGAPGPGRPRGEAPRPRPAPTAEAEVAGRAIARLQLFRTGDAGRTLTLTGEELTAVLRGALPGILPHGVSDPMVRLVDGEVRIEARLSRADFVASKLLVSVLGVLPDTVDVELRGRLARHGGRLAFRVERSWASRVPLPPWVVRTIAIDLGERVMVADSSEAPVLTVRWPDGVGDVIVAGDRLVLERPEPILDRAVDGSGLP